MLRTRVVTIGLLGLLALTAGPGSAWAQAPTPAVKAGGPTGVGDVLVARVAELGAQRATVWEHGGARFLFLEERVRFAVGAYGFTAQRAVVRITPVDRPGVRHFALAAYLEGAEPLAGGQTALRAGRLLVTATVAGDVELLADLFTPADAAPAQPLVNDALGRFARYDATPSSVAAPAGGPEPLVTDAQRELRDQRRQEIEQRRQRLTDAAAKQPPPELAAERDAAAQEPEPDPGVLPARGVVSYDMDTVTADLGDDETVISLAGGVRVIFEDYASDRVVTLAAERAVIFVDNEGAGDPTASGNGLTEQIDASQVQGVYLEDGAVISDGDYTVRTPRAYYDLRGNRALLLDAVLYTWDVKRRVPLYLRADVVRQTAARGFAAENARFTTSEFHEPHVALGAGRIAVSQYETEDGVVGSAVDASDITLRVREVPVFWWPRFAGRGTDTPLRSVRAGYNSNDGVRLETRWDLFALLGREAPDGVDADLNLDYLGEHGLGVGAKLDYQQPDMFGNAQGYVVVNDEGEDDLSRRTDIEQDGETRGFAQWQHRQNLANGFELSLEGAYVEDPTFLEEFFPDLANEERPFETSVYLNRPEHETQFTALFRTDLNDFIAQLPALQSPGSFTEKLPEFAYRRVGTPLLDDRLTWYSETTASNLRLRFGEDTPEERGFNNADSLATFGIPNTTTFDDAAEAAGLPDDTVLRFDTRQEITAPLQAGALDITPFAVGRFTAYDEDFEDFSGEDDQVRFWGQVGTRLGTELHRSDDTVRNRVLDLDGIRHIVEPNVTLAYAGTSLDAEDLPVFDEDVESLAEGGTVKLGVVNTFQTRRGGANRQRTVDWVVVTSELVFQDDDARDDLTIGRFYDYRPEYSRGGDHFYSELLWQITDAVGAAGEITYSLESDRVEQWRAGAQMQHTPRLTSFLSYEEIDPVDSALLTYGFNYQLTTKYRLGLSQTFDFSGNERRRLNAALERKLPRWRLLVTASWDQLDDEQSFGIVLIPDGFGGGRGLNSRSFFR